MSMEQLQKIRNRRLEKQLTVLQEHKNKVQQAEANSEKAQQAVIDFQSWRLNHQEQMFQGLQGQSFTPSTISDYQNQLESLSQQEEQLKQELEKSRQLLQQTQAALAQERKRTNQLAMKNEKTKAIVETLQKENQVKEP